MGGSKGGPVEARHAITHSASMSRTHLCVFALGNSSFTSSTFANKPFMSCMGTKERLFKPRKDPVQEI